MSHTNHTENTFEGLALLAEVSQLLTDVNLDMVLNKVIRLVAGAVGASKSSLFLSQNGSVDWEHLFTMRNLASDESVKVVTRVLDDGFAGWVTRNKRGDIIADITKDNRWIIFPDDPETSRSALCVPLLNGDEVLAVVTLVHEQVGYFTPYHLRLLTIIANQAVIAIRNAQLFNRINIQREHLETVLASITDALIVLNPRGIITMVNPAAVRLLNEQQLGDTIGKSLEFYNQYDSVFEPIVEIVRAELHQNERWTFETRTENQQKDYQATMGKWYEGERENGYVVVLHDITTLRDLSRFKDEMLRVATHDLRSPLALISGYADMVTMDLPDPNSPVHDYVAIIKKSVERMQILVEDLLRVERVRSSPLELRERTDLEALVKTVVVNMRLMTDARKQKLEVDYDLKDAPRIVADAVLLRQSMENLVSNAVKYTPNGGIITIHARYDAEKFYFSVRDNGIGIASEHQKYVFESFYRVPNVPTTEKGNGLGLSLVRNVVTRHNGDVWLTSELGKGSEFGFWIPLQ